MQKIYIVRLSEEKRNTCRDIIKKLKGSTHKVQRAHILRIGGEVGFSFALV